MNVRKLIKAPITAAVLFSLLMSVGCTKYSSQDDLNKLEEAREAALSAERELEQIKVERRNLEDELAAKQLELREAQDERERIKNR